MTRTLRLVALGVIILAIGMIMGCGTLAGGDLVTGVIRGMINAGAIAWGDDAQQWKGNNNQVYSVSLPAGGAEYGIWGTGVYTDDSSIGTAAVHQGLISFASGGTVRIRILPGQASYTGTTRNGVTSEDYEDWDGSFEFVTN